MNQNFINRISIRNMEEDTYLSQIEGFKKFNELILDKAITIFVGENGTGKSTLLEAIAYSQGFNVEGGSKNFNFSTYDAIPSILYNYLTISKSGRKASDSFFLRADNFYNIASYIEEVGVDLSEYGDRAIHRQSHGEGILNIINNRFRGNGLYLLDEPENGLSFQRQLSLISSINSLAKEGSQFIIVTHSPIILALPNSQIFSFDMEEPLEIKLEQSKAYEIMNIFIHNKERLLSHLFEEADE